MRTFPRAVRPRLLAASLGLLLAATASVAAPLAHADDDKGDLEQQKKQVHGRVHQATRELQEASRTAARADRSYDRLRGRLNVARDHQDSVEGRLLGARRVNQRLKRALAQAQDELAAANAALTTGQVEVVAQERETRNAFLTMVTEGDPQLRALGSFLDTASLEDYSRTSVTDQLLINRGDRAYDALRDVEDQLSDEQERVQEATTAVADRKKEAADHLEVVRDLFVKARQAKTRVTQLVGQATTARKSAFRARADDRAALRKLQQREAGIKRKLQALARQEHGKQGFTGRSDGYLSYPAHGPVTSPFGYREHPIYHYWGLHNGTDFGVGCGSSLYAAASGTVIDTYYDSVYGNRLYLAIGNVNGKNLVLVYNHLSGYKAHEGQHVDRGDVVGYVGSTGWSTGCHLHFTVLAGGTPVDPMNYL